MIDFKSAIGHIKMADESQIEFDGTESFDPRMFAETNDIIELISDEFVIEMTNGNTITFTDAQNIRLFMGHNKMLIETQAKEIAQANQEIQWDIDALEYQREHTSDLAMLSFIDTEIQGHMARLR